MDCLRYTTLIFVFCINASAYGQGCCSGGSGSPVAGNASQGVLGKGQVELSTSYQYLKSNKFLTSGNETSPLFDNFRSDYIYSRVGYGVSKEFTVSVEGGYFLNKTQTELNNTGKISSSGVGDLIIFPRYDVFNKKTMCSHDELTLGLGYKIPLGKYNDSHVVFTNPNTGRQYFTTSPPLVQPTNGSHDILFYAFYMHKGAPKGLKFFANSMYIKKGWNPIGQKFGDFAGINLFLSKTVFDALGLTLQLNAESIQKMQYDKNIDMLALYNVDVNSTGSKKLSLIPQFSYSYKNITIYGLGEIPLYQKVRGTQVALQQQFTVGLSYRFFTSKDAGCADDTTEHAYACPMKCAGGGSDRPGSCSVCGMDLEKQEAKPLPDIKK